MHINILINRSCNRNCSYCFVDKSDNAEMSLDELTNILNALKEPDNTINIIGGEPTLHSKFTEIMQILHSRDNVKFVSIMTNAVNISNEARVTINGFKHQGILGIGVNFTELNLKTFYELTNNIDKLNIDETMPLCFSLILSKDTIEIENQIKYLTMFINERNIPFQIKVSLPHDTGDSFDSYIANGGAFVNNLFKIIEWRNAYKPTTEITLDCGGIYRCMFKNQDEVDFVQQNVRVFKMGCSRNTKYPFVIEKNSTYSCFPGKRFHTEYLNQDLKINYNNILESRRNTNNVPQKCVTCNFYEKNSCHGPCFCFYI